MGLDEFLSKCFVWYFDRPFNGAKVLKVALLVVLEIRSMGSVNPVVAPLSFLSCGSCVASACVDAARLTI
jgi:hypothetical protein